MRKMQRKSQGFTLIEVMVSVLVVGIGVLGVAGMQVMSLQQNRNALLRDQALHAGSDILDRMRANEDSVYGSAIDSVPAASSNCQANSCTPVEMAEFDIAQWKCRINPYDAEDALYTVCEGYTITQAALPRGHGSIEKIDGVAVITVEWVNDRGGSTCLASFSNEETRCSSIILRSKTQDF